VAIGTVMGVVDYFAGNRTVRPSSVLSTSRFTRLNFAIGRVTLKTSVQVTERNAVTWSVFSDQEVVQLTYHRTGIFPNVEGIYYCPGPVDSRRSNDALPGRGDFSLD
jgi:hypothetical protein